MWLKQQRGSEYVNPTEPQSEKSSCIFRASAPTETRDETSEQIHHLHEHVACVALVPTVQRRMPFACAHFVWSYLTGSVCEGRSLGRYLRKLPASLVAIGRCLVALLLHRCQSRRLQTPGPHGNCGKRCRLLYRDICAACFWADVLWSYLRVRR